MPEDLIYNSFVRLNKELQQVKGLLNIAEPVDWASATNSNYYAQSLLSGDEAILVVVLDRRYFSEQTEHKLRTRALQKKVGPAKIKVKIPQGFVVCEVKSIYRSLPKDLWNCHEGQLSFIANMINSAQVYTLVLVRKDSEHGLGDVIE